MRNFRRSHVLGVAIWTASALLPSSALACGGFFCNRAQPVNQAAEGIIFADNGDGTVTAVIQIQYQGPSQNFSWLLPISSVPVGPELEVASNLAFQRLQSATNPNYTLTVRVEGTCKQQQQDNGNLGVGFPSSSGGASSVGSAGPSVPGVKVDAMGVVGSFAWSVISIDASTANAADSAVTWLKANGYDVPSGAPSLLAPYLEQGMHLLALKLTKGADSGSIRPIVLTYEGSEPSIPIRPTAVAANDDMGVLAWVLGKSRSVPKNYLSLELNEARINWFNAASNYNSVVTQAANDAQGQGFVTEFAGPSSTLDKQIWTTFDQQNWSAFSSSVYQSFAELFNTAYAQYGQWDGFWDATRAAVTLPDSVAFADFKVCPTCYADQVTLKPSAYIAELEKNVIAPMKRVQTLIDAQPEITRLYTTISADEMTLDPLFGFNPDLPDVSNQHTAERIIECSSSVYEYEAPWRIELPQGTVVRGTAADVGNWPAALGSLPPNRQIVRASATGAGRIIEDNSNAIKKMVATYNAGIPGGSSGSSGSGTAGDGAVSEAGSGANAPGEASSVSGGCSFGHRSGSRFWLLAAAALGAATWRRRRS